MKNAHCSICAEPIAIGMALTAASANIVACAAIARSGDTATVWSPCGSCRELLRDHSVGYVVVVDDEHDDLIAVPTAELLPWP
jgi:cytidine deaminase